MKMISSSSLARIKGVTKQAVAKAIKNGKLLGIKKGNSVSVDLQHKLTKLYLKNMSVQEINERIKKVSTKRTTEKIKKKATKKQQKLDAKEQKESNKWAKERAENLELKRLAELDKINAATHKMNIEIAEKVKELIPRELCESVFQNMSNVIVNYFFTLGERLAPEVAGICKVNDSKKTIAIKERIDEEVQRCLEQFKKQTKITNG